VNSIVRLARDTIEKFVRDGEVLPTPKDLPTELAGRAGAFVSIKKKGQLRGCIGTIEPGQENLAAEIIRNAISAATQDPRFPPITPEELEDLSVSVDVLGEPEPVSGPEGLDPHKYGVIVERGWQRGLLLPALEGVDTVEQQVDIARQKAGIVSGQPVQLYRFTVTRYK